MFENNQSPKNGAQRKRDHDRRKRKAGLKEFRAWVTESEARQLRECLAKIRNNNQQEKEEQPQESDGSAGAALLDSRGEWAAGKPPYGPEIMKLLTSRPSGTYLHAHGSGFGCGPKLISDGGGKKYLYIGNGQWERI